MPRQKPEVFPRDYQNETSKTSFMVYNLLDLPVQNVVACSINKGTYRLLGVIFNDGTRHRFG